MSFATTNTALVRRGLLLMAVFAFAGCTQYYEFQVDALSNPYQSANPENMTYYVVSGSEQVPANDLRLQEAARYLERALVGRGLRRVDDRGAADMIVELSTRISEPQTESRTYSDPVYYRTRGYFRAVAIPVFNSDGSVARYVHTHVYSPGHLEFAGYHHRDLQITVFEKSLELTARDSEGRAEGEPLWTLQVTSVDESRDLREYLPYMVAAAIPYIGTQTEGMVGVRIPADDAGVEELRGRR